ncbi:VCBS repeat-containing protein [Lutimonas vermicola]|uniref:VCBS repeat-containing protein n=1 Tax=Lutimonas vermicola TaxID=414288 RepID=A0ABU9KYQ3_9FLAO
MKNRHPVGLLLFLLILGCSKKEGELFKNPPADQTGIDFVNTITETDDLNILDYLYFYNGGGVALGDINNDGLTDVFFTGNQVKNRLYLNKGNLKFEDITEKANIAGNSTWNTGTIMGDVNGDGLLDIYVCAVVGLNGFNGFNELYINNGDLTFTESAEKFGLDSESYSSSAVFLDFDLDNDLDIYILNHAVHTQESFGRSDLREKRNYQTGDKLMRNDNGVFTDVSETAGIYGGVNGYGLGVAVADFNQDGYPDIYVSNDFHEDDYYYLNNGDGTFSEKLKDYFGHTTRFSMGNDAADINHDAWPDILSLDMLPEDETILKSSDGDESLQILDIRVKQYGYHYQFTRNMLHINQPNSNYVETALLSGVAATDWSWSGLFADYDQDGEQDLFISNGIPKRPNNLDFIKFISSDQIKNKINNSRLVDQEAIDMMPSGKSHNYIFKGGDDIIFKDKSGDWTVKDSLISGATAIGDLDNDGDLDIVINNINDPASLYINKTNNKANYLKIKFDYIAPNTMGIGTKVLSYHQGKLQYKELYTGRGFQSSSEPLIHFGYQNTTKIDSIRVIWPDRSTQLLTDVPVNQSLVLQPQNTVPFDYAQLQPKNKLLFAKTKNNLGISYEHKENRFNDFNRQKLIPYKVSDRGPATAVGDLNNDQLSDIFIGGSNGNPSKVYIQKDSVFSEQIIPDILNDSLKEDVSAIIADLNGDGKHDLFVGSGGAGFHINTKPLQDSYLIQNDTALFKAQLPDYFGNASVIKAHDIDQDGDLDLFVGSHVVSNEFGKIPESYLLINNNGQFELQEQPELKNVGFVTDAVWTDFDSDGLSDLIVVGEWMEPTFFKNNQGLLQKTTLMDQSLNGLWQKIYPFDIDRDGDLDFLLGNWGTNTKFKSSATYPMKMYYHDFDQDGKTETIVAIEKDGKYYPLPGLDELSGQMVRFRRKYTSYKDFAGKTMEQIFDKSVLKEAKVLSVDDLHSGYLKNEQGKFIFVPFPVKMQVSPITSFCSFDFDKDGQNEVLAAGNYFGVQPFHGRFDSFSGALIKNETDMQLGFQIGLDFTEKAVRQLNIITLKNKPYLLVTVNSGMTEVYDLKNY